MFDDEDLLTPEEEERRIRVGSGKWGDAVTPKEGWYWRNPPSSDHQDMDHVCEMCEWKLCRYVQHMVHPTGLTLDVGKVCAGWMSGNTQQAARVELDLMRKVRKAKARVKARETFPGDPGWVRMEHAGLGGRTLLTYRKSMFTVALDGLRVAYRIDGDPWQRGSVVYESVEDAQRGAFDALVYIGLA